MKKQIYSKNQSINRKLYVRMYYSWPFRLMVFGALLGIVSLGAYIISRPNDSRAATGFNLTAQPGGIAYNVSSSACAYARPGGMVIAGRGNYGDKCFKDVSASGGHVFIYLDALLFNTTGRYHDKLYNASECGPAASKWLGNLSYNGYGIASDFRVGSVVQNKLECVLELMVSENPHMAGFFADDLGGSNGPDQNGAFNREEWYQGAVALSKTYRKVADKHHILFMVNGMWQGGSSNAGYPVRSSTGNALADGVCVEHHPVVEGSFDWPNSVLNASQWADQSSVTNGTALHFVIALSSQFSGWQNRQNSGASWLTVQAGDGGYDAVPSPWAGGHSTGLPTKVGGTTSSPSPSPTLAKPAMPKGVKLTPGDHKIVVSWNSSPSSEKVDNYQVYLNGSYSYTNVTTPTYTIAGTPGQTFTVRVSAHNSAGYGPWTDSYSAVVGSSVVTTTPSTPSTPGNPIPVIEIPNANSSTPVDIPKSLSKQSDGTLVADFNGDGLNDVAKDTNNDNKINPVTEIVVDGKNNKALTDTNQEPVTVAEYEEMNGSSSPLSMYSSGNYITYKYGNLPEAKVSNKTSYTILIYQSIGIVGLGSYFAITKLTFFGSIRRMIGIRT